MAILHSCRGGKRRLRTQTDSITCLWWSCARTNARHTLQCRALRPTADLVRKTTQLVSPCTGCDNGTRHTCAFLYVGFAKDGMHLVRFACLSVSSCHRRPETRSACGSPGQEGACKRSKSSQPPTTPMQESVATSPNNRGSGTGEVRRGEFGALARRSARPRGAKRSWKKTIWTDELKPLLTQSQPHFSMPFFNWSL